MQEESERREVINQCLKLIKAGGDINCFIYICLCTIIECLLNYPQDIKEHKNRLLQYFSDGLHKTMYGFTDAYFIDPENIEALFSNYTSLKTERVMATEGLGNICEAALMQLPEDKFMEWIDLLYKISDKKAVWGSCAHMIYVGRKKD